MKSLWPVCGLQAMHGMRDKNESTNTKCFVVSEPHDDRSELDMRRVHVGSGLVWLGRVQLCGSMWVTLDDTEGYAKFNCKVYIEA